jgi:hypothetical protein
MRGQPPLLGSDAHELMHAALAERISALEGARDLAFSADYADAGGSRPGWARRYPPSGFAGTSGPSCPRLSER